MIMSLSLLLFIIFYLYSTKNKNKNKIGGKTELLNIYNQELKKCGNKFMAHGSWDSEYKCSELDGGVHQICIKNIKNNTPNFSSDTGQPNWSDKKIDNNNHCVCLGAWSLYNNINKTNKNKNKNKILKCDAIPKNSLSNDYISKFSEGWNKWNGLEVPNQIVDGVNNLIKNCITKDKNKNKELLKNYCSFSKNIDSIKNTQFYKKRCKNNII